MVGWQIGMVWFDAVLCEMVVGALMYDVNLLR